MDFMDFMNGEKKLSAGLILTNGKVFLAVKPTGHNYYDIPKGEVDNGDSLTETLIREIKEEVGIDIGKHTSKIKDTGKHEYLSYKDAHMFLLVLENLPPTSVMRCVSTFDLYGRKVPEVYGHKYVSINDLHLFKPAMARIIKTVLEKNEIR